MTEKELRAALSTHLNTLKRNLAVAPLLVLKTKYKKPFDALCRDICEAASAYTKQVALKDIRIQREYLNEAVPIIQSAVQQSGLLRQISTAAFSRQSITEIESLAQTLHEQIQNALEPFYTRHTCLYLTTACFTDPPQAPELFNDASGCIWRNGEWKPLSGKESAILLFIQDKQDKTA